ncbi:MAG: hypothetical protein ACKO6Q_04010 [Bacteroidota bacterium]
MRLIILLFAGALSLIGARCGSPSVNVSTFCDTTCLKDTLRFMGDHETKPEVALAPSQCLADTLTWTYKGMGTIRKVGLKSIMSKIVPIQASHTQCVFDGNKKAWLLFNDCATGRGYQIKLPYDKKESISIRSSGINSLDPKFSIDPNVIAYTDRGNIYVEHVKKGTTAMMTFKETVPIDYEHIHDHLDSVRVTPTKIWVRIKIQDQWKELEKEIDLESTDK